VGLLVLIWILMPEVRNLTQQMETVLTNLELVTSQLAGMDLGAMVQNVDELVVTTREGLGAIDFQMLNQAIEDLADVVEPLAKFFNVFQ
jgi:hypothetical protein